jgi:hypothetical protein
MNTNELDALLYERVMGALRENEHIKLISDGAVVFNDNKYVCSVPSFHDNYTDALYILEMGIMKGCKPTFSMEEGLVTITEEGIMVKTLSMPMAICLYLKEYFKLC